MKSITRKILSVLLTVLMLGQSLPATLSFASAEEVFYIQRGAGIGRISQGRIP